MVTPGHEAKKKVQSADIGKEKQLSFLLHARLFFEHLLQLQH
jgi:hypothetical protein